MCSPSATSHARLRRLSASLVLAALCAPLSPRLVAGDFQESSYCNPEWLSRFGSGWPAKLDTNLYWFGPGDQISKAETGKSSSLYDPNKKTVIYFHGWTGGGKGWTNICKRITTRCPAGVCPEPGGQLLAEEWFRDGWNVGIFYWDQFADEDCTRDAEQKIWFDRKGDGFRWKSFDPITGSQSFQVFQEPIVSVTDLCVRAIKSSMGDYLGPHVRFVGHSIGAQLATRCAAALHEEGHTAAPQRLTMLEPYFSKHHLGLFRCEQLSTDSGLGEFTAKATADYVKKLWEKKRVVTEIYKSSVLTELSQLGVPNEDLEGKSVLVQFEPHWCGGLGPLASADLGHLNCRHCAAMPMYFLSYGRSAPPVLPTLPPNAAQPGSAATSCSTPVASCTDGQIKEWVERQLRLGGGQKWVQDRGMSTFTNIDDAFELTPEISQLYGSSADAVVEARAMEADQVPWWHRLNPYFYRLKRNPHVLAVIGISSLVILCVTAAFTCYICGAGCCDGDDEENSHVRSPRSSVRSLVTGANNDSEEEDEESPAIASGRKVVAPKPP